ncbi:AAA family ATPase [Arthrobacter sp. H20]|uniref:dTMP kinase n=1 Tax=Arthrobacter sp. H20 TaxID=1267981 RepID=UPI00047ABEF6|nr:AAA family ATPase [Arthrobacter sp. H20]
MLIVLAGIDGAGKTTAGKLLTERLSAAAYPATFTMNQSGRRSMTAWSARHNIHPPVALLDALETTIRCVNVLISHIRAMTGSGVLIMDRHLHCQLALRQVRGLRAGWLLPELLRVLPTPDIVFYFEVDADIAHARVSSRAADSETFEHLGAFDQAYRELRDFPSFITIDASPSSEQVVDDMLQELGVCGLGLQP